jgi:hypothetical protein
MNAQRPIEQRFYRSAGDPLEPSFSIGLDDLEETGWFIPAKREFRVTPAMFSRIQERLLADPQWAEHDLMRLTGPGEVRIIVQQKIVRDE